ASESHLRQTIREHEPFVKKWETTGQLSVQRIEAATVSLYPWGLPVCLAQVIRLSDGKFRDNRINVCIFRQFVKLAESTNKFRKQAILLLNSHATLSGFDLQKSAPHANAAAPSRSLRRVAKPQSPPPRRGLRLAS